MWAWVMSLWGAVLGMALAPGEPAHITIVGATSCLSYIKAVLPDFERDHPGVTVAVAGGGSVAGLIEAGRGRADLGLSDIPPEPQWTGGISMTSYPLGRLPILFVVNRADGVQHVTEAQLRGLLGGTIRRWNQLGGRSWPVIVVSRPLASGARYVVEHRILQGRPMSSHALIELSNGALLRAVAETPGAIGYVEGPQVIPHIIRLRVNGQTFSTQHPLRWPYFATPRLYARTPVSNLVRSLARYLTTRPQRVQFGIYPEESSS
ncbi:phosphate binding protein [Sulfobacillus acidophilus TPY]|uniref:Phosphate ABC transporter substrate-binding protein, PhoT family n=1 Tax=Sulfobacillus acidophilus (strain ATCC 700253 / DSM 10332 / NAL) TaxID=679936 RepID=G8U0M1_SULAD|nr:phosphate binding protein [Sulfobacillus acidophilus TPY]AEW04243.1 phosphate ABC transporter substrate-binding protein, PhoT family [Sulfobacillus acidophilus DSM 10332]